MYLNTATQVNFPQGIVDLIKGEEFTTEMQLGATQVTGDTWGTYLNAATDAYSLFYRLQGRRHRVQERLQRKTLQAGNRR